MTIPPQVRPSGFTDHAFDFSCTIDRPWGEVWDWLLEPDTFVKGQFWPFRVEFLDTPSEDGSVARGFDVGTLNAHHGPFMNFCGVITRVEIGETGAVRDLEYAYGAYALAFRLIRPTLLRIEVVGEGTHRCRVDVRVESFVRSWFGGTWTLAQRCFWPSFGRMVRRAMRSRT
ncbi:MAG: hypothetical protein VX727_00685 [Planctomycetota bacterium]|nr:hypothetical protein [Planctomycetota bacterium]